ncbi:MAG: MOSC domain-containing protein [bacterium]
MHIVSVNVSRPREVTAHCGRVTTGVFKQPIDGRVRLRTLNLDGDMQADLTVHGGPNKAVYAYPVEHYTFWRDEFPEMALPWGMFGENLTAEWMREDAVNIGDRYRVGTRRRQAIPPRSRT